MVSTYQSLHIFEHVLFNLTESLWVVASIGRPYAGRSPGRVKPNANFPVTETLVSLQGLMLHCLHVLATENAWTVFYKLDYEGKAIEDICR